MLNKCASPDCDVPFRKLSEGRLYLLETDPGGCKESKLASWRGQPTRRVEYYWLCDACAIVLTLFYEKGRGVVTVARTGAARMPPAPEARTRGLRRSAVGRSA